MKKSNNITEVSFRSVKYPDGQIEVLALFPYEPYNGLGDNVTCYAHVGQHACADYNYIISMSRPALKSEYVDLETELFILGYTMELVKRRNLNRFIQECKKIRS